MFEYNTVEEAVKDLQEGKLNAADITDDDGSPQAEHPYLVS